MLVDSDVLIWALRGREDALNTLAGIKNIQISVIAHMEVIQGALNKSELTRIKRYMTLMEIITVPLTESIGAEALKLVEKYCLSHGLRYGDALIAATALYLDEPLLTDNRKHYQFINNLSLHSSV